MEYHLLASDLEVQYSLKSIHFIQYICKPHQGKFGVPCHRTANNCYNLITLLLLLYRIELDFLFIVIICLSWFYHEPDASLLSPLSLSFLISEMKIMIISIHKVVIGNKWNNTCKILRIMSGA